MLRNYSVLEEYEESNEQIYKKNPEVFERVNFRIRQRYSKVIFTAFGTERISFRE